MGRASRSSARTWAKALGTLVVGLVTLGVGATAVASTTRTVQPTSAAPLRAESAPPATAPTAATVPPTTTSEITAVAAAVAPPATTTTTTAPVAVPAPPVRLIVTARDGGDLAVYPAPGAPAPSATLPAINELDSPLVLLAIGRQGDWFHVLLPTRPNGSTAWVRAGDVNTAIPEYQVELSQAAHQLRVLRISDGAVVLTSPVGVGRASTPTPNGEFFVRDWFPVEEPNHPYGPFAFGLSGHSDVFMQFGDGDGRIAIHGTNQPSSIGANMSNGCPHVANDVVLNLKDYMPLGTPVIIT